MKFISTLCLLCICSLSLLAISDRPFSKPSAEKKWASIQPDLPDPYIDAKVGYFFFSSSTMDRVYPQGGLDLQLSGGYPIVQYLRVYGSGEYFRKSGHSLNGDQKTSIWNVPLSIGLQPVVRIPSSLPVDFYFTIGPRYIFSWVHNDSAFVSSRMKANGLGGFINAGFQIKYGCHFIMDFFGEYSYARLSYKSTVANSQGNRVQVGGFTFGGGIGYAF